MQEFERTTICSASKIHSSSRNPHISFDFKVCPLSSQLTFAISYCSSVLWIIVVLFMVYLQWFFYPKTTVSFCNFVVRGLLLPTVLLLHLTPIVSITRRGKTSIGFYFFLDFIIFRVHFPTLLTLEVVLTIPWRRNKHSSSLLQFLQYTDGLIPKF